MRNNRKDKTPYAVYCNGYFDGMTCGLQFLSEDQYLAQLNRPDSTWRCPKCSADASWDDDCQATNPAED